MAGTNPDQGAALARATAEALAERAGAGGDHHHYDALKALAEPIRASATPAWSTTSSGCSRRSGWRDGTPGRSYALDIATRMGLPATLLERARALAGGAHVGLEEVIASLEAARGGRSGARPSSWREARASLERHAMSSSASRSRPWRSVSASWRGMRARRSRLAVREAREAMRAIVREAQQAGFGARGGGSAGAARRDGAGGAGGASPRRRRPCRRRRRRCSRARACSCRRCPPKAACCTRPMRAGGSRSRSARSRWMSTWRSWAARRRRAHPQSPRARHRRRRHRVSARPAVMEIRPQADMLAVTRPTPRTRSTCAATAPTTSRPKWWRSWTAPRSRAARQCS